MLLFEAVARLDDDERHTLQVMKGMLIKHEAKRWVLDRVRLDPFSSPEGRAPRNQVETSSDHDQ